MHNTAIQKYLVELLSTVTDCHALICDSFRSDRHNRGVSRSSSSDSADSRRVRGLSRRRRPAKLSQRHVQPDKEIARARSLSRLTDLQMEALSAIECFCLLCSRYGSSRNASNALVMPPTKELRGRSFPRRRTPSSDSSGCVIRMRITSGELQDTLQEVGSTLNSLQANSREHPKPSPQVQPPPESRRPGARSKLGKFRTAIIRQLWDIHHLLRALLDETPSESLTSNRVQHRGRGAAAVEMQLDTTSTFIVPTDPRKDQSHSAFLYHNERHNLQDPSGSGSNRRAKSTESICNRCTPEDSASESVSEWNFASLNATERQLSFASTLIAGNQTTSRASKVKSHTVSLRSQEKRSASDEDIEIDITLPPKPYKRPLDRRDVSRRTLRNTSCLPPSASTCTATTTNSAPPKPRRPTWTAELPVRRSKLGDSIVFQRVISTGTNSMAHSRHNTIASSELPVLVSTLTGLKQRIDVIKQNLSHDTRSLSHGRRSDFRRRSDGAGAFAEVQRTARWSTISNSVRKGCNGWSSGSCNQSNLGRSVSCGQASWTLRVKGNEASQLGQIRQRLDATVARLSSMLNAMLPPLRRHQGRRSVLEGNGQAAGRRNPFLFGGNS